MRSSAGLLGVSVTPIFSERAIFAIRVQNLGAHIDDLAAKTTALGTLRYTTARCY